MAMITSRSSCDVGQVHLGTKAESLRRLRPLLRCAKIGSQIDFTVADWRSRRLSVIQSIRTAFIGNPVAVRSSAIGEDSQSCSQAGAYTSVLNVRVDDELEDAVDRVIASYRRDCDEDQVFVQAMVKNVAIGGVVLTRTLEHLAPWYVLNYNFGVETDAVTAGRRANARSFVFSRFATNVQFPDPRLQRLLDAVSEVETLVGHDALDIEFAIDRSSTIYLLQVREIPKSTTDAQTVDEPYFSAIGHARDTWIEAERSAEFQGNGKPLFGVMPDWNPAEIIGLCPGKLASSLYDYLLTGQVWAEARASLGYRDLTSSQLMWNFAGHPYVDVRVSIESFLPATIPDPLAFRLTRFFVERIRNYPELHDKLEFEVMPTCFSPDFEMWRHRLKHSGAFGSCEIDMFEDGLRGVTLNVMACVDESISRLNALDRTSPTHSKSGNSQRSWVVRELLDVCRRQIAPLFVKLARSAFVAVSLLRGAQRRQIISEAAVTAFLANIATVSGNLAGDAALVNKGLMEWTDFERKYGHLRPSMYDIRSRRYDAESSSILRFLISGGGVAVKSNVDDSPWRKESAAFGEATSALGIRPENCNIEELLRRCIAGREYGKYVLSRYLSNALEAIATWAAPFGLSRNDLAEIPIELLLARPNRSERKGILSAQIKKLADQERQARSINQAILLPPILTTLSDFDYFLMQEDVPNFFGNRPVIAECIQVRADFSPEQAIAIEGKIAVLPNADPGFDWLFTAGIAGLITMYGGANSHMAIRATEFHIPAAIGVGRQLYLEVSSARMLYLDPTCRSIQRVQ